MTTTPADSVPYATATPSAKVISPTLVASVLIFAGLGLIGLGGCFLIGVMIVVMRLNFVAVAVTSSAALSNWEVMLVVVLYLLAFTCTAGGLLLLVPASMRLFRILGRS